MADITITVPRVNIAILIPIAHCRKAAVVLAAAIAQFGPDDAVRLILTPDDDTTPTAEHAGAIRELFGDLERELGALPHMVLAPRDQVCTDDNDIALWVSASGEPIADAQAILALSSFGRDFGSCRTFGTAGPARGSYALARAEATSVIRRTDHARRLRLGEPMRLGVVLWSPNFWGAVENLVVAATNRDDVTVDVVLLNSDTTTFRTRSDSENRDFFLTHGIVVRDEDWLRANLDQLDVIAMPDPYDTSRPGGLQVRDFVAAGIRLVYLPYATSLFSDEASLRLMNLPLHNLAWRIYVPNADEVRSYSDCIGVGGDHVRNLGGIKNERLLTSHSGKVGAELLRAKLGTDTVTLWTPHWSYGAGGVSTFANTAGPIMQHFADHPGQGLIVRPHPRLLVDLERDGVDGARQAEEFRSACALYSNIHLDEEWDHLPAMRAADALVSDLSSVISEYLSLNRPIAYLRRADACAILGGTSWLANVVQIEDPAQLATFLRSPARPLGATQWPDDRGSGARVAKAIVEDYFFELHGERRQPLAA